MLLSEAVGYLSSALGKLVESNLPHQVDVKSLPQGIVDGLRKLKFKKKTIDVHYSDSVKLRGLKSKQYQVAGVIGMAGNVDRVAADKEGKIDIPRNTVFFHGFESGSGSYGHLVVPKSMTEKVIGGNSELTDRQKSILSSLVTGKNPKQRMRLLNFEKVKRPELDAMEKMGLLTIDMEKRAVAITAKGKSLRF